MLRDTSTAAAAYNISCCRALLEASRTAAFPFWLRRTGLYCRQLTRLYSSAVLLRGAGDLRLFRPPAGATSIRRIGLSGPGYSPVLSPRCLVTCCVCCALGCDYKI
jgi:hypothetical protein